MKVVKISKISQFFTVILFVLFFACEAIGATYYSSPAGSGTACSDASPCSLTTGLEKLVAGDTLYLKNGIYYQTLDIKKSGAVGNPIIIRSQNDGQAIIDGQNVRNPFKIIGTSDSHKSYINVEGIVAKNSSGSVIYVQYADYVNVKRVSGYNANAVGNYHIFDYYYSTHCLIEDCAATGKGRFAYDFYESQYITVRRCWGLVEEGQTGTPGANGGGIQIYGSDNCKIENNVMRKNTTYSQLFTGISVWANTPNLTADYNTLLGNVVMDSTRLSLGTSSAMHVITGNSWKNNVAINAGGSGWRCFEHGGDGNLMVENMTCIAASGLSYQYYMRSYDTYYTVDAGFVVAGTLKNSSFVNGGIGILRNQPDAHVETLSHTYNNFYNASSLYSGTTAGTGEKTINPAYNTATYGKGAYLTVPTALQGKGEGGADIGAEVIYSYENGVLTDVPLWPWPMEDRIKAETGYSVTWESGGGLWKTLDGVYSNLYSDSVPPAPPKLN